jgi:hypothetical protein
MDPRTGSAPASRKHIRWMQVLALLFLLPLVIRFGAFLVRLLVRGALEITPLVRGTPVAAGLVLLTVVILVLGLARSARRKRKKG